MERKATPSFLFAYYAAVRLNDQTGIWGYLGPKNMSETSFGVNSLKCGYRVASFAGVSSVQWLAIAPSRLVLLLSLL